MEKALNNKIKKLLQANRGTAIYLSMFLLTGVLAIALAVSTIAVGENRISKEAVNSMQAVYIADSAVEYTLHEVRILENTSPLTANDMVTLPPAECKLKVNIHENYWSVNRTECDVTVDNSVSPGSFFNCPAILANTNDVCVRVVAKGSFGGTNRAIEIVFPSI
jgi:Tfp pilus assembly protein PilX